MSQANSPSGCVKYFYFRKALLQDNWLKPAYIGIDENGMIRSRSSVKPTDGNPIEEVDGVALPGFRNCHSHAFQYAMAGMAERHQPGTSDDFWSWREAMYQ